MATRWWSFNGNTFEDAEDGREWSFNGTTLGERDTPTPPAEPRRVPAALLMALAS